MAESGLSQSEPSSEGTPLAFGGEVRLVCRGPAVDLAADVLRDWIHETPMSECNMGADVCLDWPLAYRLAVKITARLDDKGFLVGPALTRRRQLNEEMP